LLFYCSIAFKYRSSSYSGGRGRKIVSLRPARAVIQTLSQKRNKNKRAEGMVQVIEYWPSKCEDQGSTLSATKSKKTETKGTNMTYDEE
jgi:hypothetical protein